MVTQGPSNEGRMPVAFVCHGGGPMPIVNPRSQGGLSKHLQDVGQKLRRFRPKAVLLVSAHWEESQVAINSDDRPELLYDYYGFPPETYQIKYPAPGDQKLASRVRELLGPRPIPRRFFAVRTAMCALASSPQRSTVDLESGDLPSTPETLDNQSQHRSEVLGRPPSARAQGIPANKVSGRGWDHGVFVPLLLMLEAADIPVLQVSLLKSLDPEAHLALGEALAPLRDEGVAIVGSGMTYHNLRLLLSGGGRDAMRASSVDFHSWLKPAVCDSPPDARRQALSDWKRAPSAVECHPREEHLLPLLVCAGAAASDAGHVIYDEDFMGAEVASFWFGPLP